MLNIATFLVTEHSSVLDGHCGLLNIATRYVSRLFLLRDIPILKLADPVSAMDR